MWRTTLSENGVVIAPSRLGRIRRLLDGVRDDRMPQDLEHGSTAEAPCRSAQRAFSPPGLAHGVAERRALEHVLTQIPRVELHRTTRPARHEGAHDHAELAGPRLRDLALRSVHADDA